MRVRLAWMVVGMCALAPSSALGADTVAPGQIGPHNPSGMPTSTWNRQLEAGHPARGKASIDVVKDGLDFTQSVKVSPPDITVQLSGKGLKWPGGPLHPPRAFVHLSFLAPAEAQAGPRTVTLKVGPHASNGFQGKEERFTVHVVGRSTGQEAGAGAPYFEHFQVSAGGFSWTNAALLVAACAQADKGTTGIKTRLQPYGFEPEAVYPIHHPKGDWFFAARDDMVLVVVRGTDPGSIPSWLQNADLLAVVGGIDADYSKAPGAAVHAGYRDVADEIYGELKKWLYVAEVPSDHRASRRPWGILDHPNPRVRAPKRIFLAGHSQGGGVATLVASRLHLDQHPVGGLYLYASPNAGNPEFAADYDQRLGSRTFRFIYFNDPVPRLPPYPLWKAVGTTCFWFDLAGQAHLKTTAQQTSAGDPMNIAFAGPAAAIATANVASLLVLALQCHPVEKYWRAIDGAALEHLVAGASLPPH